MAIILQNMKFIIFEKIYMKISEFLTEYLSIKIIAINLLGYVLIEIFMETNKSCLYIHFD